MRNKLPINPIVEDGKDYFYNQRGAKVYKDINKQPMLPLHSGQNEFYVLSVGFSQNRIPLVTISENDKPICYRLPNEYSDWTMTVVGFSSMGERLFPSKVLFSLIGGRYLVDAVWFSNSYMLFCLYLHYTKKSFPFIHLLFKTIYLNF